VADNIVDITFTDVKVLEFFGGTPFIASISGSLEINYTTGVITHCALTASGIGFITTSFTSATLTTLPFGFDVRAASPINNSLNFTYIGFQPDHLSQLELSLGGFSPSFTAPPFLDNLISSTPAPCFVEGTLIRASDGDVAVRRSRSAVSPSRSRANIARSSGSAIRR
jgi:hypothetical protein